VQVSKLLLDVQRLGRRLGIEVRPYRTAAPRRHQLLMQRGIDLVLDVGANQGYYVRELRAAGYTGRAISFEPGQAQFALLSQAAAADPRWSVHQLGLSDESGTAELALAGVFSSVLRSNDSLLTIWPEATSAGTEVIPLARLDDLPDVTRELSHKTLLKIDVQGTEMQVLAGAAEALANVDMIEIELTITPLYDGQPLMVEVLRYLDDRGFDLVDLDLVSRNFRTGHNFQFDGILVRRHGG
jgi:FkbM family methyltransferase